MFVCIYFGMFCHCSQLRLMLNMFVCIIVVIWWLLTSEAEIQQKRVDQLTKEWRPVGNSWVMQGCFMEIHGNPDDSCGELAVTVMVQTNKNFSVHMDLIISFHSEMSICFHSDLALFISKSGLMHQLNHSIWFLSVPSHLQGTYYIYIYI